MRIVAPARSLSIIPEAVRDIAAARLGDLGLTVTFGAHVEEVDAFNSTSVASRVADLHAAFADPAVAGILTVIGGYNSNQLLRALDWALIRDHPKVFCGYSDITALGGAILARAGLVTYSGPHFSTLGQRHHAGYTVDAFAACVMADAPIAVVPSACWTDDPWYEDQENRRPEPNPGFAVIGEGEAEGRIVGGNLCTFNLLQGTEFVPDLAGAILFLEDDFESPPHTFDRDLQSLVHQPGFEGVRGLVIGRFQRASGMTPELLRALITSKPELRALPIVAGVDFGHTDPKITFPLGGVARIGAAGATARIEIVSH